MTTEFDKHKEAFLLEARAHLEVMNSSLLKLEKSPEDSKYLHDIFRAVHTLKSMSAAMNFNQVANLCHILEDLLDAIRNHRIMLNDCVDELFLSFDLIANALKTIENENQEPTTEINVKKIRSLIEHQVPNNETGTTGTTIDLQFIEPATIEKVQSIEVKVDRLDTLLKLVEVSKVAALKASSSLSKLINQPVDVDILPAKILSHDSNPLYTKEDDMVVGINILLSGELQGTAILFFSKTADLRLCDVLLKRKEGESKIFTETEMSALTEIANIVIGNFMGSFAHPLKLNSVLHHVPDFRFDSYNHLIEKVVLDMNLKVNDKFLVEIIIAFQNLKIRGFLVFFFGMEEMKNVLG